MQQNYILTIRDLYSKINGELCGAEAEVAILENDVEIDRVKLSGRVGPGGNGYQRNYSGKPGLTAGLVAGVGQLTFAEA
ncbi:hypothetical protein F3J44_18330 [Pantoea sp. Tr-811]|uniref:hypothetical protein n=1 Tax=Pantoea sp. Tr-811 TaxID=2608361 RepID=UPI00141E8486|nr:hypothetical protein [Pantoea sp. Tr-811]NIF28328.1 hypothetical protein [Pantoea sp. Tr-811]